jgi:hypothetical protein
MGNKSDAEVRSKLTVYVWDTLTNEYFHINSLSHCISYIRQEYAGFNLASSRLRVVLNNGSLYKSPL